MSERGRQPVYQSGECEIDLARRELRTNGVFVPIGSRAFEIIETLVQSAGQVVSKDALMQRIWPGAVVNDNTLQVHISAVRKALGPYRTMLKTESNRGYRLLGSWSVRQVGLPSPSSPRSHAEREPARPAETPVTSNFPEIVASLVGRSATAQRLQDLLSAYRLITLTGPGGIGKTTLALVVARNMLSGFAGGGLVELASLADPALVPSAVASALGLRLSGEAISAEAIARAIGDRHLLVVLDNCEHVIDAAAGLAETVMRLCPHITVLATSREVLRIEGEFVYRIPPLDVPPRGQAEPEQILGHSAVELFIARIRALDADFAPDGESLASVAAICQHLDGMPLAIELAAARAATLGARQVALGLGDRFALLTGGRRTALPRHQTLRATLDWSYGLLSEEEAAVLCRLAVFAGDFSVEAASAVVGDLPGTHIVEQISNLVAKSLVAADLRKESAYFRLLETTRFYAAEKLRANAASYQSVARRHAEHYRDVFADAEAESETRPQAEWLAIYGRHIDNVRAALDWAFSAGGDPRVGVALTIATVPLWIQLSLLGECRERVERALAALDGDPDAARPRMQLSAALGWSLMYGVGRAREAGPAWAMTLTLAERLGDTEYQLRALWGLCIDQFNNGEFRTAFDFAQRFAELSANSTDAIDLMMADRILATALHYLGDQNKARHHIERTLAQLAALAQQPQIVRLRFDLRVSTNYFRARILWLQGLADQALDVVEHNIAEGLAIGHALTFCSVLGQGACPIAFLAGDLDAAARYGAMLLDHTERNPIRLWHLWARCFNGIVAIHQGDTAHGLTALRGALDEAGEARFLPRFLLPLAELAACLGTVGDIAQGLATIDEALTRCKARDEGWCIAELLRIKAELLLRQGGDASIAAAEDCFHAALAVAAEQGALFWQLRTSLSLARWRVTQNKSGEAKEILGAACARFAEGSAIADLRTARTLLAALP